MTDKRTLLLSDDDMVLYSAGTREALHATVLRLYEVARDRAAANQDKVDRDTGEVAPRVWRFTFGEDLEDLTAKQRRFLHGVVFKQMAEQLVVNGQQFHLSTWKEHCREKFLGTRQEEVLRPDLTVELIDVRVSTEDLTIKQYSEYIDRVIAYATTELGMEFNFDQQEREAVRYRKPQRRKAQPETPQ